MPLAHPSTLDRRTELRGLTVPASYVEGFWSPALLYLTKNRKLKHSVISASLSVQGTEGPFSLGRGLILDQRFLNLSIFLSFDRGFES